MKINVLRSALARRSAVDLVRDTWADVPILASEWVLRNRIRKFGCHDRPSVEQAFAGTHAEEHSELEQHHGADLRRNVALGFVGRRAAEKYLREMGADDEAMAPLSLHHPATTRARGC